MKLPAILSLLIRSAALLSWLGAMHAHAGAPPYVLATAHYILPETTSEESGYFSLSESLDGAIHVGTAKYGHNAFLVEFDPRTGRQRVVLDTAKTCGLSATGYAAQSKLHTRNFTGRSGRVYVGSKQGYPIEGDKQAYPGGFVMTYDPRTGRTENLGMPLAGQGVIDIVADEARDRLYAVTCEEQHWMTAPLAGKAWRELGPMLTPYAATLVDTRGVASAITKDFELAQFDPATERVITRPIFLDGKKWTRANGNAIPIWQLDPDGRHAWLILMNDPSLLRIDLHSAGDSVTAENCGAMHGGKNPDCRSALTLHPDGKIYALIRVDNTTGFGTGYLHHLVRYDPEARRHEDLGVLKVANPDYFDWSPGPDGQPKPHTHGFHRLPDDTLTPLHAHMALLAARDGTLYATILYPFTLLKIDAYKIPAPAPSAAATYLDRLQRKLDEAEARLPEIAPLAERLAERHLRGGLIGFPWIGSTLEQELMGRSGGLMHIGFDRCWKAERTAEEKANDVVIFAWDDAPKPDDLKRMREYREKGVFVLGFGARSSPKLAGHVAACDAWIDCGSSGDEGAGKTEHFTNAINGWLFIGEFVAALTRHGKMPVMWKSYGTHDGHAWADRYFTKTQFHEDVSVPPVAPGELGQRYLERIRFMVARLRSTELGTLRAMGERIAAELQAGRKTIVASSGHMVMNYVGRFGDALWAENHEVHDNVEAQMSDFEKKTPDGALVLRLDSNGLHRSVHELFARKHQRVLLLTAENPRPEFAIPADGELRADLGFSFGDACVSLDGYPIPILPPSGVMQIAAYEAINVDVHARRGAQGLAPLSQAPAAKPAQEPLDDDHATALAQLALAAIDQEFPNKPGEVLAAPEDLRTPRGMHPAFYGCFDWHSSVHGHWMLVRLLRLHPGIQNAAAIRARLDAHLTAANLQAETAYFGQKKDRGFERMYGWAWALRLAAELRLWDDADAKRWAANLAPLENKLVALTADYLPRLTYPIRTGVHPDTAFALGQIHDYARTVHDAELATLIGKRARDYYLQDRAYPAAYEPSGEDFFSPGLNEADLMRRVLSAEEFAAWLDGFIPGLAQGLPLAWAGPAEVSDLSDPRIVHLVGLNLSRAWTLQGIASALPPGDPRRRTLETAVQAHAAAGLRYVFSGHYEGEHWLATFAVYHLTATGTQPQTGP